MNLRKNLDTTPFFTDNVKMLPYIDWHFAKYQNVGLQELRSYINWQIQREIFFMGWFLRLKPSKDLTNLIQALCKLASSTSEVA